MELRPTIEQRASDDCGDEVLLSIHAVERYAAAFPGRSRRAIVRAIVEKGPLRAKIEAELASMSHEPRSWHTGLTTRRLAQVLALIDASLHTSLSVVEMAATVFLSPFHFSRQFAKSTGFAPHAYLTLQRVDKAKVLLRLNELTIALIAEKVGYRTQAHFTGVFTRAAGITPARYRRNHLDAGLAVPYQ
jgi:AraC-like DNA-binding protein